ncbi:MAG: hypothetical protein Q9P01_16350 [Anaerolineae bacterium]|nr:hypothetical protein [Anaerolineae bacterium]MDQ7036337.1 hypothetical protein [Anaerolineae bacterium]
MSEKSQKSNIFHNSIFVLAFIFFVPALLVVGGTWITASYGRIPGGTSTECERTIGDVAIGVEMYRYVAGLTPYETQTFFVRQNNFESLEFYRADIQTPYDFDCEEGIRQLGDEAILIVTQKGIAITQDNAATWQTYSVCNWSLPVAGRCNVDFLNIIDITFDNAQQGRLVIQEAVTNQYNVIVNDENGQPRIINEYILVTTDGGLTWNLAND